MPKTAVSFKPKQVTKKILSPLKDRAFDVVVSRFGLGNESERKTLEAIGEIYGITRERVRQIENAALLAVRKSDAYKAEQATFDELHAVIKELGGVVSEEELLKTLAKDSATQNHIHFYLVLGDAFTKHKEDESFEARWSVDDELTKTVHSSLKSLYENLSDDEIVPESELIGRFLEHLKDVNNEYKSDEIAKRYLSLSKKSFSQSAW